MFDQTDTIIKVITQIFADRPHMRFHKADYININNCVLVQLQ